jgi:serine/threonine protein kinase
VAFDGYHKWLGIPPAEQPPTHYRLLGIAPFEDDAQVIAREADRLMAHVHNHKLGAHSEFSQRLLSELAQAKACLLSAEKKADYDTELRQRVAGTLKQPNAKRYVQRVETGHPAPGNTAANASVVDAVCPDAATLREFGLGKLDGATAETISQHLDSCVDCREKVANLSSDGFIDLLRAAAGDRTDEPCDVDFTFLDEPPDSLETTVELEKPPAGIHQRRLAKSATTQQDLVNHPDYELVKELGQGGMGVVYLARNRMMDRLEVLKVLNKSLLERPGAMERFQQEIRSAARLSHINIVAAYAVPRGTDSLVFSMEYVPGQDLAQLVRRRGQLPVANAAFYIHQAALGLQHAHEKGMVHRDIKPNNLMLAVDGKKHIVKILDFGLAKATIEKDADTGLTNSGQILGTPDYMAPEQSRDAQRADIRADIYSLGCTLYFLLSGSRPFQESSLYDLMDAHQKREATRLDLVRPEIPRDLADVVAKMMAKNPAERYPAPIEVARALLPFFKAGQTARSKSTDAAMRRLGGSDEVSARKSMPMRLRRLRFLIGRRGLLTVSVTATVAALLLTVSLRPPVQVAQSLGPDANARAGGPSVRTPQAHRSEPRPSSEEDIAAATPASPRPGEPAPGAHTQTRRRLQPTRQLKRRLSPTPNRSPTTASRRCKNRNRITLTQKLMPLRLRQSTKP